MRAFQGIYDGFIGYNIGLEGVAIVRSDDLWKGIFGIGAGKQIDLIFFNQAAPVCREEITVVDYFRAVW